MSKHTPGPWEAIESPASGWSVRRQFERPGYTGLAPICNMAWFQFPITGIIDDDISEANARLIAAAPELLAALQGLMEVARDAMSDTWYETDSRVVAARAAIAKATAE